LPVYILLAWVGIEMGGVVGAAIAWAARGTLDLGVMMALARRRMPGMAGRTGRLVGPIFGALGVLVGMVFLPDSGSGMLLGSVVIFVGTLVAWRFLLGSAERQLVWGILATARKRVIRS
jgi:hypothetical protein